MTPGLRRPLPLALSCSVQLRYTLSSLFFRSAIPGDPFADCEYASADSFAQPRPGRKPRRHLPLFVDIPDPAFAQPRPGRKPRRHQLLQQRSYQGLWALNQGRGVNPGDTLGRLRWTPGRSSLNQGRGVNPGDTSTDYQVRSTFAVNAQPRPGRKPRRHSLERMDWTNKPNPLNQGRGVNPGDTSKAIVKRNARLCPHRSTKAGA